jgi:hypothetical protein
MMGARDPSTTIAEALARYEDEHSFARTIVMAEEDRRPLMPNTPWQGGYRWFRSPNVICLEKARRLRAMGRI